MIENIHMYHLGWYFLGFMYAPRLTVMILLTLYCPTLPLWFTIFGWVIGLLFDISYIFRSEK